MAFLENDRGENAQADEVRYRRLSPLSHVSVPPTCEDHGARRGHVKSLEAWRWTGGAYRGLVLA